MIVLSFTKVKILLSNYGQWWLYLSSTYLYYYTNSLYVFKRLYTQISADERSKFTKKYKKEYELTQEQKEAIIGIMLADGFLEREKPSYNTRLSKEHTYPEQESYVLSIYGFICSTNSHGTCNKCKEFSRPQNR